MIKEAEVFPIGKITKTRGIKGEVEMTIYNNAFDAGNSDYFVMLLDGIFVPFFWQEYQYKNHNTLILQFEDFQSDEFSKRLVGCNVYYPFNAVSDENFHEVATPQSLVGFKVLDENHHLLGIVDSVDDSTSNILLYMTKPDNEELILPFHQDFLVSYDLHERIIVMNLPVGLIETN